MASAGGRRSGRPQIPRNLSQIRGCRFRGGDRGEVVALVERCARFLHGVLGVGYAAPSGVEGVTGDPSALRSLERGLRVGERAVRVGEGVFGVTPRSGLAAGGLLRRVLRALARVERVIEGEPVVAIRDGIVGALEGVGGGGEFVVRELVGAGGARGINRALRLLQLFLRRIAAGRGAERRDNGQRQQHAAERHFVSITPR